MITINTNTYDSHDEEGCLSPANPCATPDHRHINGDTSITEDNRQHRILGQDYNTWHETDRALKSLLLVVVTHIYIEELEHETLVYENSTTLKLLTHLWDTYGTIDKYMMANIIYEMNTPWAPHTSSNTSSPKSKIPHFC